MARMRLTKRMRTIVCWAMCMSENFRWFSAYYNLNERECTLNSLAFNKRVLRCLWCVVFVCIHRLCLVNERMHLSKWSYVKLIKFILFCAHAIVINEFIVSSFANNFDCLPSRIEAYAIAVSSKINGIKPTKSTIMLGERERENTRKINDNCKISY